MTTMGNFHKAIQFLQNEIGKDFQAHQLMFLLELNKTDKPIDHPTLQKTLGLSHAAVNRTCKIFGQHIAKDGSVKGKDWLDTRPDLYETRRLASTLNAKGKKFMKKLAAILEG